MNYVFKVGSVNLNSSSSAINKSLLREFVINHDIDIIFLQEVCYANFSFIRSHSPLINIGENGSGTAILIRNSFEFSQPLLDPNGRISSVVVNGVNYVNIYAFSGSNRKKERDQLFINDLAVHLGKGGKKIDVIGGDFNCILNNGDSNSSVKNFSTGLKQLIEMFKLKDVAFELKKNAFTFIRNDSSSRLDRFYTSSLLLQKVVDFATIPVAFSDHFGILMTIRGSVGDVAPIGRGYWKVNSSLAKDDSVCARLVDEYQGWKLRHIFTTDRSRWWNEVAKHKMRQFFKRESFLLNTRISNEKSYFYGKMIEWTQRQSTGQPTLLDIRIIKSRLIEIEHQRLTHLGNNIEDANLLQGEMINIFQVAAQIKRMENCGNFKICSGNIIVTDPMELSRLAFEHFSCTFQPDAPNVEQNTNDDPLNYITRSLSIEDREEVTKRITEEELRSVLQRCSKKKSPGPDGLTYEVYLKNFDCYKDDLVQVFNSYLDGSIIPPKNFSDGIITLIPKKNCSRSNFDDYRPISLLNCDYKLFMKLLAERTMKFLDKLLGPGQTACIPNMSCGNNLKNLRRLITKSCESKKFKGCIVSLDLNKAFDRVNHDYLWKVMQKFNFPDTFIDCLKRIYANASSRMLINGFLSREIKINCSVRQGCPMSMVFFVLYVEPLIRKIADSITGVLVHDKFINVFAYADDLVVFCKK